MQVLRGSDRGNQLGIIVAGYLAVAACVDILKILQPLAGGLVVKLGSCLTLS